MLVLSRKRDEKIIMNLENGEEIEFTVLEINGNKVRLGIKAPNNVSIIRSELAQRSNSLIEPVPE